MNLLCTPRAESIQVANGSSFGGVNLLTLTGVGVSLILDGSQLTGPISVQLNGDPNCIFTLNEGVVLGFGNRDIYFTSVDFANSLSGNGEQSVQVIVGIVATSELGSWK